MTPDVSCVIERPTEPAKPNMPNTRELALDGQTNLPVSPLGLKRFAKLDPNWKTRRQWETGSSNT